MEEPNICIICADGMLEPVAEEGYHECDNCGNQYTTEEIEMLFG